MGIICYTNSIYFICIECYIILDHSFHILYLFEAQTGLEPVAEGYEPSVLPSTLPRFILIYLLVEVSEGFEPSHWILQTLQSDALFTV